MDAAIAQVGPRVRAARHARDWTLDDLARRAGLSVSTLSRLESGKRGASLELLLPVTRALGIRIDDLLPPHDRDPRVRRPVIRRDGLIIAPLTHESAPVQTLRITYPADRPLPEPRVHDGFEWLYVLSGRLRLRLGDQDLELAPGEAAEFDTRTPHAMGAAGGAPAEVLSIFNGDGERMHTRVRTSG
ncbi:MAG: XRE family transcriptional regulator [Microbacterium sp.]|jgi:transcriptional regulator with XRE-family HTH domain|uniref:HTH-type transcriptional regulator PuuR n=1 Tax=Microbacterium ginsengisoli TaxID=400772 RepID=A0A0F0LV83_9MICO|nr:MULTISPECIES: XRE family transcriptional regulator [Microbacterium]MAL07936.1 XRE family transcriptional regulator [Microbacterium sp.]MCK9919886.1 XRE family transcriptional regulator [Microbacteriaceae bacterium K1510]KJL37207.1 HTH-type transcriptional regulator PuuR [Microbacterium ginsengisoli]MBN9209699.1 cupin domain-containing protein [Microbacterium ginsengisoli]ODU77724.1 MAG: XRE family transcriptional regulator [Microbacterium sp. SCN 71-21]